MRKYAGQAKAGLARQRASEESMDSKPAKTEPVPLRQGFASGDKTYSESLNLPNTPFDIRANADAREKYFQKRSTEALYRWQSRQTDRPLFVLHDGPPYANGPLHLGHTVNKILKDIINRYQLLRGNRIHYIPGWDCHGLPIEQKVTSTLTLPQRSAENVRLVCKGEAWKAIRDQRDSFKMYGIMADWSQETTYRTLDRDYEIRQSKIFGEMVRRGLIYRAHRPVYWSPSSQTALAEAEIEHNPDYHSRTVYVNFLLQHGEGLKKAAKGSGLAERYLQEAANGQKTIFAPIWTTTPWSLVSNMALTINPDLDYSLVEVEEGALAGQLYIVASDLILKFEQIKLGLSTTGSKDRPQIGRTQPVMRFKGSALLDSTYRHPFLSSEAKGRPILAAAYVSADAGTGLVHCAPAHGAEDYQTWQAYCRTQPEAKAEGLLCPIDHQGAYTDEVVTIFQNAGVETYEPLPGTTVLGTGGKLITRLLDRYHFLIGEKPIQHSTPHDWRTKKPLIVRATSQWFANLEPIKERAIAALDKVNFTPKTGRARLETLIRKRDEWCISRQRPWGVPIPVLYNAENDEPLLSLANVQHIAQILEEKGTDYWWQGEADEFVAPQEQRDGVQWIKGTDTMDVWFDSGTSWSLLPGSEQDSTSEALFSSPSRSPADVYLEGTDQHRGWFQSSLLTYVATSASTEDSIPPYRNVITHGFTVDRKGKKMSKSEGNVISPLFYLKGGAKKKETAYGADVVRWWVATTDYAGSIASSPLQIKHASDNLRKIRNSFRFLLANLPLPGEVVSFADDGQLTLMERYMLLKTQELSNECKAAYDKFDFAQIISLVGNFTTSTLSSFYLDLSKDILYANHRDSKERQGVIYVLDQILKTMLSVVGPITPHLTEEVFHFYLGAKHDPKTEEETDRSVFHGTWHDLPVLVDPNVLEAEMSGILQMRTALAPLLQQAKEDGKLKVSLEGQVTISPQQMPHSPSESPTFDLLAKYESEVARILGVSRFEIVQQGKESQIETETGPWRYEGNYDGVSIVLEPCREHRCPRCWTYRMQEPKDRFCSRCKQVLEEQTAP